MFFLTAWRFDLQIQDFRIQGTLKRHNTDMHLVSAHSPFTDFFPGNQAQE